MSTCCCCFCVSSGTLAIVERLGKFHKVATPGCHHIECCTESIRGTVPLRLQIVVVSVDSKTRDNALVRVDTRIHYKVVEEKSVDAFYKFTNPSEQIGSFATSIIRGEVPKYTLDELFLMSDQIKTVVKEELTERLLQYGFSLEATLIARIDPSNEVKRAISQTQVNAYRRTTAEHEAELNKILAIKEAEADFEEKRLSGVGLAQERKAIMKGLQSSIEGFVEAVPGMGARDVMNLLLLNQYFDAMKMIGGQPNNRLVLMPGSAVAAPGGGGSGGSPSSPAFMADMIASQVATRLMK